MSPDDLSTIWWSLPYDQRSPNTSVYSIEGMPEWERELWIEACQHDRQSEPKRPRGDWIPMGRAPIALLPDDESFSPYNTFQRYLIPEEER